MTSNPARSEESGKREEIVPSATEDESSQAARRIAEGS
jgi:hypothetical protein